MKKNNLFSLTIIILFAISITGFSILTGPGEKGSFHGSDQSGQELAKIYCATCHIFPSPSLLDRST